MASEDWKVNTSYEIGTMLKLTTTKIIYDTSKIPPVVKETLRRTDLVQVVAGKSGDSGNGYKVSTVGTVFMDGTLPVKSWGQHQYDWRTPGNAYKTGDIIADDSFLVICVQGGKSDKYDRWGPVDGAAKWNDGYYIDGEVKWQKLTPSAEYGKWRNDNAAYSVGQFLIEYNGTYAWYYEVITGTSGSSLPTYDQITASASSGTAFLNGTLLVKWSSSVVENRWEAHATYKTNDSIVENGMSYKCYFDGKVTLPRHIHFSNITTNLKNGSVLCFVRGTSVPTVLQGDKCEVIAENCDGIVRERENRWGNISDCDFGHAGNPMMTVTIK